MWIGKTSITADIQPKIGDRDDFIIRATGPGETDYEFPLSLTRTILSIWEGNSKKAAIELAETILDVRGTASKPPEQGFWFDSYNSGSTLSETKNIIRNEGINSFTKTELENTVTTLIGKELFEQKEKLDKFFVKKYNFEFFRSFDDAFEDSQAIEDLSSPAKDNAHFIYRVCILSVFIDHINVRSTDEKSDSGSLQSLKNWLNRELGDGKSKELTTTFQMIKYLRKQYPIHEHFDINADGVRGIRKELATAKAFFNFTDAHEQNWINVFNFFTKALNEIQASLE